MTTDLHAHTTASDGTLSPAHLLALAHRRGVTTLAVTDHDTTDGLAPAQEAADALGVTLVPGVELSAETEADGDIHILGYFIDPTDAAFQGRLAAFRENRMDRGRAIVRKLNAIGVPLTFAQVEGEAQGAPITRPHIARALAKAGYVRSPQKAFDRYLADGGPAFVQRKRMPPEEAVDLIRAAGGVAVMAHPGRVPTGEAVLRRLAAYGVDGAELYHPNNDHLVRQYVRAVAAQHDLILTGGSDFHSVGTDGSIRLGTYSPPSGALARLRAKAASRQ